MAAARSCMIDMRCTAPLPCNLLALNCRQHHIITLIRTSFGYHQPSCGLTCCCTTQQCQEDCLCKRSGALAAWSQRCGGRASCMILYKDSMSALEHCTKWQWTSCLAQSTLNHHLFLLKPCCGPLCWSFRLGLAPLRDMHLNVQSNPCGETPSQQLQPVLPLQATQVCI